ncbi:SdrD B-like domain-containing protein [Methylocaldum sp.]|uniref:SdrD B-like domain-containing protein n=1 Tax=Methylocaldum sp. TaxID=1969727 RepID=UPI002D24E001|nr:hypothetical protein [Methylocaldum sp.]HYE35904.1 hypothetical protein [Methylocaldum sp.]
MKAHVLSRHAPLIQSAKRYLVFSALLLGLSVHLDAHAVNLTVIGSDGNPVGNFRWLIEEDAGKFSQPGVPAEPGTSLALSFHTSYMPVVAKGNQANATNIPLDPTKRYFVSVLPDSATTNPGYTIGGAPVAPGQSDVTVYVNRSPLPTAQISVFAFNDNRPINNAPDLPEEQGLADFTVKVYEAGGTYGQSGGEVTQDAFGNPLGIIKTDANGVALIKNLVPAKYTIFVIPPTGSDWHQTATIEGTKGVDAWVKSNEPPFFTEFGPPGHHVFIGFVNKLNDTTVLNGGSTITGKVVNLHTSRPPEFPFYNGHPFPNCWVGLNDLAVGEGQAVYAQPCNADSSFSIPNVPPGNYQLVVWDEALDIIFASHGVTVSGDGTCNTPDGSCDLVEVPVFDWFSRLEGSVFFDANGNGFRDAGEVGMPDQNINLRFRDGSIYQSFPTKADGSYSFEEIFPFFNWLVAEVDFARFKATGATVTVDAGGAIPSDDIARGKLNPQPQSENGNAPYRTETGAVLLEGIQGFLGQTSVIDWGKQVYPAGQNGGVSGIVHYPTTRAEDDPRYAAAENWEPGIPRVQVNLYRDDTGGPSNTPDGIIDDLDGNGAMTLADVDNYPFGWSDCNPDVQACNLIKGPEDVDRNGNGAFDRGDAYDIATTDSWDDNLPTGCQGDIFYSATGQPTDCYDGLRNFNQVRPALFDGGYAFGGPAGNPELPGGTYIVEAVAPPGYEHQKEEDKNVDFGDEYTPSPLLLPPVCVGDPHLVPAELSLFPGVPGAYAGQTRPLCDRKQVRVAQGQNAAADFYMFTEVPIAGHMVGMILDDLSNEFDPNAPTFGEKYAPPYLPVSIRDWTGREINRVHADQWGRFNALVPSTFTINPPMPSGVAPNMLTACMNSPTMPDPNNPGGYTLDPYYNPRYSQFCYTFQYLPGKTTYLDTPVLPIAAFASLDKFPLDCEQASGTPMIYSVTGTGNVGPYVQTPINNGGNRRYITIRSMGQVEVPNPAYDGSNAKTIVRDYGFGDTQGIVRIGNATLTFNNCSPTCSWSNDQIVVRVPPGTSTGELVVTRANGGASTVNGVTVTVGGPAPIVVNAGQSIQTAIDAAPAGALITVAPGEYDELPIMHKKVRLQGWGAGSTIINAAKFPAEKLQNWRNKLTSLLNANQFSLLPGQEAGTVDPQDNEPTLFNTEEGAGITVVANTNEFTSAPAAQRARIDGFTITGADHSGGIFVNGYANWLEISNNRIIGNNGIYGGGIRIGNPQLINGTAYTDNRNYNVRIHHNQVVENGSNGGLGGGGITIATGSRNYEVTDNFVCGNFTTGDGGGIAHLGLSSSRLVDRSLIARNTVVFNQTFNQGLSASGGGVFIGGLPSLAAGGLSAGAGNVTVDENLIQGNMAGAGDGGGIRTRFANGADVLAARNNPNRWYEIQIRNNRIVDNIAGLAGGGISMQDTARIEIFHNTIAHNDSTATAGEAFSPGSPNRSTAQPAGIVSRAHSAALAAAFGNQTRNQYGFFSNPDLLYNIVWRNRSFFWEIDNTTDPSTFGLWPVVAADGIGGAVFHDLAVLGTASTACLNPRASTLTSLSGPEGCSYPGGFFTPNNTNDPSFAASYFNSSPGQTIQQPEVTTALATAPAFDEGGNFIDVHFGPLTLFNPTTGDPFGDYRLP